MKFLTDIRRFPFVIISLIILNLILVSCENKIDFIPKSDFVTLPSLTVKDFETIYLDSGRRQIVLSAPLLEKYDNKDFPHSDFRKGIKVLVYEGKPEPEASATAKYARYTDSNKLWELKDSVVVINKDKDKLETEVLYWDETKDLIYTDRFVKITSTDQIIQGFGFESDARLTKQKIKKVTATITIAAK